MNNLKINDLEKIFKSLSDQNRLRILKIMLSEDREMNCGEISSFMNISLSTVSYHFKILRMAGLTKMRKEKNEKILSLNQTMIESLNLKNLIMKAID